MKIRSKTLYKYLVETNAIRGNDEAIGRAKQAYRQQYKRKWKQQNRPQKELRIGITLKQFTIIEMKARDGNMRPTTYARHVILAASKGLNSGIQMNQLYTVLQLVSMATTSALKQTCTISELTELLTQAETLLLQLIQKTHT